MASFLQSILSLTDGRGIESDTSTPLGALASSLISLLYSLSALRVVAFGGALETLRRLTVFLYSKFLSLFWLTAYFDEDDESFDWMQVWLAKQPAWAQARDLDISTDSFLPNHEPALLVPGEEDATLTLEQGRLLAYRPASMQTVAMWYHGRYMTFTRILARTGRRCRLEETLKICVFARSHRVLNELMLEAKKEYKAAEPSSVRIYAATSSNDDWTRVASRPKRKIDSVILDPGVANLLVDDARDFLGSKAWYGARGIPFRRGYLLYGAPGSGKTSIITSIAGVLDLDVYIVSLSRTGLDDSKLSSLISELPEQCIAIMEDIDAALVHNLNRDAPENDDDKTGAAAPTPPPSRLSLSGLLNALDGVAAQEGRILFATTNKYHALDAALCRPGRMDVHVEFKLASRYQAEKMFCSFYIPGDGPEEDEDEEDERESSPLDAGPGTNSDSDARQAASSTSGSDEEPAFFGNSHKLRGPKLRRKEIVELAARFAAAIPERELSMAALQGFLMGYKVRPYEAVDAAPGWVESEREARAKLAREVKAGR
ncbi:P-loop containing nucleoside triphosphate hydrolase protein [Mycena filopes]|nr:P-loop containing nucleoside triphosphate hydrolase protein [Mycena filopes]